MVGETIGREVFGMPMFHAIIRHLNRLFDDDKIDEFAQNADQFLPGLRLSVDVLQFPDAALARLFQAYVDGLPGSFQEVLRSLFSYALSASPPIPMSFSWAPAYDYELTMFEPACGILVQFGSPISRQAEVI